MWCIVVKIAINPIAVGILSVILLSSVGACGRGNQAQNPPKNSTPTGQIDSNLTFQNVTSEQVDEQGRLLWKVKAKQARYTPDQKIAQIQDLSGELFQDGKLVFRISAKRGEVQQDGRKILLKDQIVATDTQDGVVLKGQELEWQTKDNILIVRYNLTGSHRQLDASAQEARVYSRERRIELMGQVVATTKDPVLRLKAEQLTWRVPQQLVTTTRPIEITRPVSKTESDRATGEQAEVNLKTKVATLKQNAQLRLISPPLDVSSNAIVWNVANQTVASDQPLRALHREQAVTVTADRGQADLQKQIFYLTGNVQAIGQRNQTQLNASLLTWYVLTRQVEAEGNVSYRQANPPLNLSGPKAFGKLDSQTIVISGGRVVTQIVP